MLFLLMKSKKQRPQPAHSAPHASLSLSLPCFNAHYLHLNRIDRFFHALYAAELVRSLVQSPAGARDAYLTQVHSSQD